MKLLSLQFKSSGEIEATIHNELYRLNVISYHRDLGAVRPLPTLKQARDEMYHSFGYMCAFEGNARVWLIRQGEAYHVYVGKELPAELLAALTPASFGDVTSELVAPGWTKLVLHDCDSLTVVVGALRRWMAVGAPGVSSGENVEFWRN